MPHACPVLRTSALLGPGACRTVHQALPGRQSRRTSPAGMSHCGPCCIPRPPWPGQCALSKPSGAERCFHGSRCSRCSHCPRCPPSCHLWARTGCCPCESRSAAPSTWGCAESWLGPVPAGSPARRCLPGPARCRRESCRHGRPNKTVLQSMVCRSTSAQMETELSRSLSPRPARRQYLS